MLYEIKKTEKREFELTPVGFTDFKSEKDLENLISYNLLQTLFEDGSFMPIFQERQWQAEADIYALNPEGDLIIFELKKSTAGVDALHQTLRYAQLAANWSYATLQNKYQTYEKIEEALSHAHQAAFDLETPLTEREFNQRQHLVIIGSAANNELIKAVDYWKKCGINIEFNPYRFYKLHNKYYFEFFSKPYDRHTNPGDVKGVIFDTNKTYDSNAIWDMFENEYVASYGEVKHVISYVNKNDIVFLSHKGLGIVGACKITGEVKKTEDDYTWYRKVKFLTTIQVRNSPLKAMPFWKVKEILEKNFYWARTIKAPYLTSSETDKLLEELRIIIT